MMKEKWYNKEFEVEKLDQNFMDKLRNIECSLPMGNAPPNLYMPRNIQSKRVIN